MCCRRVAPMVVSDHIWKAWVFCHCSGLQCANEQFSVCMHDTVFIFADRLRHRYSKVLIRLRCSVHCPSTVNYCEHIFYSFVLPVIKICVLIVRVCVCHLLLLHYKVDRFRSFYLFVVFLYLFVCAYELCILVNLCNIFICYYWVDVVDRRRPFY